MQKKIANKKNDAARHRFSAYDWFDCLTFSHFFFAFWQKVINEVNDGLGKHYPGHPVHGHHHLVSKSVEGDDTVQQDP
jgi:hypothetical protein